MRTSAANVFAAIILLCSAQLALAEWRCDCTTIVDSCSANVELQTQWVEITTDREQCSRVDYFIDGLPFVSVVVDGESREDWITRNQDARVMVQSCQVCRDNTGGDEATTSGDAGGAIGSTQAGTLEPMLATQPNYPVDAQARGIEGSVTVEFVVTPYGDVESPRVTSAQPAGVFDMASLSAVSRWRYPPDPDRDPVTVTETLSFNLGDFIWNTPAASPPSAVPGPINRCVRQNTTYNFGEMIEVGLMATCDQPLIVFACSVGTGAFADRWMCTDSETQRQVLVAPGDPRVGATASIAAPNGLRAYDYADSFFVARAPNTEYWWVACKAADIACRDEARQWIRSVGGQTANVDPQQRSRLVVARSY